MNKKYLIVATASLFLLIVLFLVILIVINQKKAKQQKNNLINPTTTPSTTYFNNLFPTDKLPSDKIQPQSKELAIKVDSWLNSMKNSADDQYYYSLSCSKKEDCKLSPTDKQVSISVLWSLYKRYKKSGNLTELNNIKQDIVKYSERSKIKDEALRVYQPDFWHCRFLYEMAKDNVFNDEYKNHLKSICQNNNYFLARADLVNILNNNNLETIFPKDQRRFAIYNTMISDFVSMYQWFADDQFLKIAKMYFTNARNYSLRNNLLPSNSAYLAIASLDLYLTTKNNAYLASANDLYNRFVNIDRNSLDIYQLTELCLTSKAYYNNISKDQKYLTVKNDSISKIIKKGFDSDKGAFYSFNLSGYSYETRNNALLVECLND